VPKLLRRKGRLDALPNLPEGLDYLWNLQQRVRDAITTALSLLKLISLLNLNTCKTEVLLLNNEPRSVLCESTYHGPEFRKADSTLHLVIEMKYLGLMLGYRLS